ncbi:MAG: hypothetical protein Q8Q23_05160 [bacterium]|nr:hypothetical protein [bacterium]
MKQLSKEEIKNVRTAVRKKINILPARIAIDYDEACQNNVPDPRNYVLQNLPHNLTEEEQGEVEAALDMVDLIIRARRALPRRHERRV